MKCDCGGLNSDGRVELKQYLSVNDTTCWFSAVATPRSGREAFFTTVSVRNANYVF